MYYDSNQIDRIQTALCCILCDKECVTLQEWRNMKNIIGFFVDSSLFFSPEQSKYLEDYFFYSTKGDIYYVKPEI